MSTAWRNTVLVWLATLALGVAGLAMSPQTTPVPARSDEACETCSTPDRTLLTFFPAGKKEPPPAQPASGARAHAGFKSCLRCHNSGVAGQAVILPGGGKLNLLDDQWVLYKEYPVWAVNDKHGQAYTVLLNERSKAMGKLLEIADVHRDQRCLACHTGFPLSEMQPVKDGVIAPDLVESLDLNLGVSCEGCHGPAEDVRDKNQMLLKGWKGPHEIQPRVPFEKTNPWRFLSPETKRNEFGFFDVRSPAPKTKLCVSCHIGDVEQGRIVTHDMYAAGHPPLPGFEIETFIEQMPKHWVDFDAKGDKVKDLFLKNTADPLYKDGAYKKDSLRRTRTLLAGAVAASGEYLRLVGQLADKSVASPVKRASWPELAVFDCYACHHDLKSPAWRQLRKPPVGVPGRPPLQEWPFALTRIALKLDGMAAADVDAKLADVRKALAAQPFGNGEDLTKPALTAGAWFSAKSHDLQTKTVTHEQGLILLKEIAAVGASELLDYDSARQLVWAFQVVNDDLKGKHPEANAIAKVLERERWRVESKLPKKDDPNQEILWLPEPSTKDMFLLNLRAGRKAATTVPGDKEERKTTEVDLEVVLPILSRYEPAQFQERFREIAGLLKTAKTSTKGAAP